MNNHIIIIYECPCGVSHEVVTREGRRMYHCPNYARTFPLPDGSAGYMVTLHPTEHPHDMRRPFIGARVLYHTVVWGNPVILVADVLRVYDGYKADLSFQLPEGNAVYTKGVIGVPGAMRKDVDPASGFWSWPET